MTSNPAIIEKAINGSSDNDEDKLVKKLLRFRTTYYAGLLNTTLELHAKIEKLYSEIAKSESEINKINYGLYNLSATEIKLVESRSQ